jgi:hypothetical protein
MPDQATEIKKQRKVILSVLGSAGLLNTKAYADLQQKLQVDPLARYMVAALVENPNLDLDPRRMGLLVPYRLADTARWIDYRQERVINTNVGDPHPSRGWVGTVFTELTISDSKFNPHPKEPGLLFVDTGISKTQTLFKWLRRRVPGAMPALPIDVLLLDAFDYAASRPLRGADGMTLTRFFAPDMVRGSKCATLDNIMSTCIRSHQSGGRNPHVGGRVVVRHRPPALT